MVVGFGLPRAGLATTLTARFDAVANLGRTAA